MDNKEKAIRVLASQGKAPVLLTCMTDDEVDLVAGMISDDGVLVSGVRILFADWLAGRNCGCDGVTEVAVGAGVGGFIEPDEIIEDE